MTIWILLSLVLCLNILIMWRISISEKLKKFTRPSATPMGIIIFISPFIEQYRLMDGITFQIIGLVLISLGIISIILALMEFHKFGITIKVIFRKEFQKKNVSNEQKIPQQLATTGPYAIVRHPQMMGFIIFYIGYSLLFLALYCLCWIPILIVIVWIAASIEENDLEKQFGQKYQEYKKRVGTLFPRIRKK